MQDVASGEMAPKVSLSGESRVVAMQVDLRRSEPPPVPYAHQPNTGEFSSGGLAFGTAEAQSPLRHLLVEDVLGGSEGLGSQITEIPPCLEAIGIAPALRFDDTALAQSAVDI
ncbi:hypothetical protein [Candidatus Mycolicibacterium alkanivorans]|uniref:Uncharacterized protein n=1 Tax=Candidatus Mycolicibacterium alkanivorans TaxID=2954114 RepID=A0ABS9YXE1_9MYCO|nr:hypothetical protein [Candidatus Mycolicibacterium alkanivorans]MCI4675797.1 hypothetical protein [Candidatus Mycolicibacterium alkanivorans]